MAAAEVSGSDLGHLHLELHRCLHKVIDHEMTAAGLSLSRAKVLMQLEQHGPMNQAALASLLGFAPRSVTDTVDALEREGFASRTADPHDRRARIVEITAPGQVALKKAQAAKAAAMEQIFSPLTTPQRVQLAALLTAIRKNILPPSGESCDA